MHKLKILIFFLSVASIFTSCGVKEEQEVSTDKYNELVNTYNDQVNNYNSVVKQNMASDLYLIDTSRQLADLDEKAQIVRSQTRKIRDSIGAYTDKEAIKSDMKELDEKIQSALAAVRILETQTSKKNMDLVISNSDTIVKNEYRDVQILRAELASKAVGSLSGIRDLLLSQYNDLITILEVRLIDLPLGTTKVDLDAANEGSNSPSEVSPIVSNYSEGGKVVGIARDSVSGQPVKSASVGFKRKIESTDYFYKTTTDHNGRYSSVIILPGTYYVDIKKDGYINIKNQIVRINRGQESTENLSLSEPLEDDVFRITMSWSEQKIGAVRDVDSYLQIPGVATPNSYKNTGKKYHGTHLDRDDTDWIGPETVTILELKQGIYRYYVNNYSDRGDARALGNSNVRVKVYKGQSLLKSFIVPSGKGKNFEIFRIINGQIHDVNSYDDSLMMH